MAAEEVAEGMALLGMLADHTALERLSVQGDNNTASLGHGLSRMHGSVDGSPPGAGGSCQADQAEDMAAQGWVRACTGGHCILRVHSPLHGHFPALSLDSC